MNWLSFLPVSFEGAIDPVEPTAALTALLGSQGHAWINKENWHAIDSKRQKSGKPLSGALAKAAEAKINAAAGSELPIYLHKEGIGYRKIPRGYFEHSDDRVWLTGKLHSLFNHVPIELDGADIFILQDDLDAWLSSKAKKRKPANPGPSPPPARGRPIGSGYDAADQPLLKQMLALQEAGQLGSWAAAAKVVAAGIGGARESQNIRRLRDKAKAKFGKWSE